MLVFVDDDLGNLGRCERAAHQFRLIIGPGNDVDLFAAQFLHDGLHPSAFHADARADWVNIGVLGIDRDLRAPAGFPRTLPDLDNTFVHFGNFLGE